MQNEAAYYLGEEFMTFPSIIWIVFSLFFHVVQHEHNSINIKKNNHHWFEFWFAYSSFFGSWWRLAFSVHGLALCFWIISKKPRFFTLFDESVQSITHNLFPKVKTAFKGTRFESVEVVRERSTPEGADRRLSALFQTMEDSHGA